MTPAELWIYASFFAALVAAGFGFPLPEEIALGAAGVAAASGAARWYILLPLCIVGVLLADIGLYLIGHRYGDRILEHRWLSRFLRRDTRQRIHENFHRYGVSILIVGRLVPGIRAPLFLTAGTTRLPLSRFMLADGVGAIVGNSLFFVLGFWLGDQFLALLRHVESYRSLLLFAALVAVAAVALYEFLRHPVSTGDPKEVPIIGPQVAGHMKGSAPERTTTQQDGAPAVPSTNGLAEEPEATAGETASPPLNGKAGHFAGHLHPGENPSP
jgi:membrane protein DedA with SNARE-associated domain